METHLGEGDFGGDCGHFKNQTWRLAAYIIWASRHQKRQQHVMHLLGLLEARNSSSIPPALAIEVNTLLKSFQRICEARLRTIPEGCCPVKAIFLRDKSGMNRRSFGYTGSKQTYSFLRSVSWNKEEGCSQLWSFQNYFLPHWEMCVCVCVAWY